jgi:hypothetical protein
LELPTVKDNVGVEYDFVMTVVDLLSGYTVLVPCAKKGLTSAKVAKLLMDRVVLIYGCPARIVSDQDVRFTSAWWKEMGISHRVSLAYRAAGHGAVERVNKAIVDALKIFLFQDQQRNWLSLVGLVQFTLNDAPKSSGWSANRVVFGRDLISLQDQAPSTTAIDGEKWIEMQKTLLETMKEKLKKKKEAMEEQYRHSHKDFDVITGDRVWVYRQDNEGDSGLERKLLPRWRGPFRVGDHVPNVWNVHDGADGCFACHVERMKRADQSIELGWVK